MTDHTLLILGGWIALGFLVGWARRLVGVR